MMLQELLTPEEVAKILKVDKRTVYYWINRKTIPYIKVNRKVIRFRATDVEEFLQKHTVKDSDAEEFVNRVLAKLSLKG